MNDRTRKLLFDVLDSGRAIREWCAGRSFDEYFSDRKFRRAVEREFEIIGEALHRLGSEDGSVASQIAELPRIVAFRNRIIHGYDSVDDATVWGVIEKHLPQLVTQAEKLLKESEPAG
ncbi:MAG: DUF86 domain-containing protein [Verrucomicrobia bacterium]|nr:MAG: DUF86 domain-containing protein [Verrucomicrobiota bacterium]